MPQAAAGSAATRTADRPVLRVGRSCACLAFQSLPLRPAPFFEPEQDNRHNRDQTREHSDRQPDHLPRQPSQEGRHPTSALSSSRFMKARASINLGGFPRVAIVSRAQATLTGSAVS